MSVDAVQGLWFEDLEPGSVFRHPLRRTVSEFDNTLFSSLTMNPQPLHLDATFAEASPHGERIVNSLFTLGLVVGMTVYELTLGTTLGNLGFESVIFPAPVRHGDTIRAETEVLSVRESKSRPNAGIVLFEHRGFRQNEDLVVRCSRNAMMLKRPTKP